MPSLVVSLLSERSATELESIRDKARADLARLTVELEQIEAALVLQGKAAKGQRSYAAHRPAGKVGSSRNRVLKIVAASDGPISPAQIRHAMAEQGGHTLSGGGLYTLIKRLTEEGELRKIADGQYALPARNGDHASGPTKNGARDPLSTDARPQAVANE
jgi:hypothetical protein